MTAPPAPDERVPVRVPVRRRLLDRPADLLPSLEPPALQRQAPEHLPPRLDQVQVRRVLRLEDELPPRMRQRRTAARRSPDGLAGCPRSRRPGRHLGRDPRLDLRQEVGPVGWRPRRLGRLSRRASRPSLDSAIVATCDGELASEPAAPWLSNASLRHPTHRSPARPHPRNDQGHHRRVANQLPRRAGQDARRSRGHARRGDAGDGAGGGDYD